MVILLATILFEKLRIPLHEKCIFFVGQTNFVDQPTKLRGLYSSASIAVENIIIFVG